MTNDLDDATKAELARKNLKVVERQDVQSAGNCFVGSFFLLGGAIYWVLRYKHLDCNSFFWLVPLFIACGLIPPAISGLLRRSWRKGFGAMRMSLVPTLMACAFTASICGGPVVILYEQAPVMAQFADKDFAKYAQPDSDTIRLETLRTVIDQQRTLRDDVQRLDRLKSDVANLSDASSSQKTLLNADVEHSKQALQAGLLSDDEYYRLQVTAAQASRIGTALTAPAAAPANLRGALLDDRVYTLTREQLKGVTAIADRNYPLWAKLLRLVRLV